MDASFLGVPDVDALSFFGLSGAAFITAFIGSVTGTGGGLLLLGLLAQFFPPAVLIPVHTVAQMGVNVTRLFLMWQWVLKNTLLPFGIGALVGVIVGANLFVSLPETVLQVILGSFIILSTWMPGVARAGSLRNRFALVGFAATFLGVFVSATGTLVGAIIAGASPDRRNLVATFSAHMTWVHSLKVIAFGLLGFALVDYLPLMAGLVAGTSLGGWAGSRALNRVPEKGFRIVFKVLLTLLALRLLWQAASSAGLI
jgi:uncharacterized membrane protein YfcA